jgi:serine/threonine protein kinase
MSKAVALLCPTALRNASKALRPARRYVDVIAAETEAVDSPELMESALFDSLEAFSDARHVVCEEIGRGGMGRVLKVRDTSLDRDVAMKVSLQKQATSERLVAEARITSQLDHPNVIPVHELGVSDRGALFFTMKLVRKHQTLLDVIEALAAGDPQAHRIYTFERRVRIVQQICDALHYAHERGVIHRDVKPENVVLGPCGEVYLVDWGVAMLRSVKEQSGVEPVRLPKGSRDERGSTVGTPGYLPPEQIELEPSQVGPWSDVYSLCAVLYELLSLHHYLQGFEVESYTQLAEVVRGGTPRAAETYFDGANGRVPRSLSRICSKGLSKGCRQRWSSAAELNEALQEWLEGRSPVVCPGTLIQRGLSELGCLIDRHPVAVPALTLALGFAAFALSLGGGWAALQALA